MEDNRHHRKLADCSFSRETETTLRRKEQRIGLRDNEEENRIKEDANSLNFTKEVRN